MRLSSYRFRSVLFVVLALGFSACSSLGMFKGEAARDKVADPLPRVAIGPEVITLWLSDLDNRRTFSGDGVQALGLPASDRYWRPSLDAIRAFESALEDRMPVHSYAIQFVGIVEGGREVIVANGFERDLLTDDPLDPLGEPSADHVRAWLMYKWIHVDDGDTCCFTARYDVEGNVATGPTYNGPGFGY